MAKPTLEEGPAEPTPDGLSAALADLVQMPLEDALASEESAERCAAARGALEDAMLAEYSGAGPLTLYVARAWGVDGDHVDARDQVLDVLVSAIEVLRPARAREWRKSVSVIGQYRWASVNRSATFSLARAVLYVIRGCGLRHPLRLADEAHSGADNGVDEDWIAARTEAVEPLLDELPPAIREVVALTLRGLTTAEIAAKLKKDGATVRRQRRRGIALLRSLLAGRNGTDA